MHTRQSIVIASLLAVCGSAAQAQSINWLSPVDGNWNESAKWDMGNIPNSLSEIAVFGHTGMYTVVTTTNWNIGGMMLTNPEAVVSIGTNQHSIYGDVFNDGTIVVNTNASTFNGSLFFAADSLLSGSGSIVLNGPGAPDDANFFVDSTRSVTQSAAHTIRGAGRLQGTLINNGTVVADNPLGVGLLIDGDLDQTGGGMAGADNGAKLLLGSNGSITGGELFTSNGGQIIAFTNNHHLHGVNNTGDLIIPGESRTLIVDSTIQNNGSISINPELQVFNGILRFDNDATIEGNGTITMYSAGDFGDATVLTSAGITMTIGVNQTVEGSGLLDASTSGTIVNRGTINANDPAWGLALRGAHMGDGGLYLADGGTMNLLNAAVVSDAVFDSANAGIIEFDIGGAATIVDCTILGDFVVRGNSGTLKIEGSNTNNGVLSLNPEGNVFNANVRTETGAIITGNGVVQMQQAGSTADSRLYAQTGATLTIDTNQTVQGSGLINTDTVPGSLVVNLGTINGNDAAVDPDPVYPLELGGNHEGMGVGVYRSDDGILQLGNGLVLNGGIFDSSGVGFVGVTNGGTATLSNVTNLGEMQIFGQGGKVALTGNLTNNGTLTINGDANVFNATLRFEAPDLTIDGTGTVRMQAAGNLNDAQLVAMDGVTGTIGFDQTVAGSGTIEGQGTMGVITNVGLILADDPTMQLRLNGNHNGIIMAGAGTYRAAADSVLSFGSGMHLVGGVLETEGTGEIAATNGISTLSYGVNHGLLGVWGEGVTLDLIGSLVNDGTVHINSNDNIFNAAMRITTPAFEISGTGEILMTTAGNPNDAQLTVQAGLVGTIGENQTLRGDGQINGELIMNGTIDPDGPSRLFTTDSITLADSSEMIFDLGGDLEPNFDRLSVRGGHSIALDGIATINLEVGYAPSFGDTWDVITGATSGTFDEVVTGIAPPGQVYRVIYESSRVYVILTCDADLSGDGVINFFDVSEFLSYYSAQDVRGDLNNDGVFNFFDVSTFLQLFSQGCNP
ncbi:MAG: hypothetical protein KDA29_09385 [Phycisphaerales bacterium]|nr:hypothetical protein [Phycisphaerales bacterium]